MTYKLQCIIIMTSLFMVELASATEFNINAIDKDQRGSVDLLDWPLYFHTLFIT